MTLKINQKMTLKFNKLLFVLSLLLLFNSCQKAELTLVTDTFEFSLSKKGAIRKLVDIKTGHNYEYTVDEKSLLAIQVKNELEYPSDMRYDGHDSIIHLTYAKNDIEAKVKVKVRKGYFTFELVQLSNNDKVQLVLWGPFETTIQETIGETIGVVRNKNFAIGVQSLNMRTLGGYPTSDDATPTFNIFGTTSLVDVADSLDILYRGHTALPKDYGSAIQAYTRNRSSERIIATLKHENYVAPAYKDEGVVGSKIALFGCHPNEVLNIISEIEVSEGLPHPTLNGVWAKKATTATSAYLIQDFGVENIDEAIELTKKAGLKYLYHAGPFENWGHFDLREAQFPANWASLAECVTRAKKKGVKVGVHTLSNFITTNDPYVTPIPDKRLAKVGGSILTKAIGTSDINIEIEAPVYFNQMKNNNLHAVVIGNEIIRYQKISDKAPWTLLNCERAAFKTTAYSHQKGEKIEKLIDHGYKTFLSNSELTIEMATTLAKLYNEAGVKQISFDGLEGNLSTGMGAYGELLFTKTWFDKLQPKIKNDFIMDASRPGHFFLAYVYQNELG